MEYMKVIHAVVQLCMTLYLYVQFMGLQESYSIMWQKKNFTISPMTRLLKKFIVSWCKQTL